MLDVRDVHKNYDGLKAVNGVSLHVPEGKIIGLIGPNGSGKSTLINVLSGTVPATSGSIHFDGHDITQLPASQRFDRGLVRGFQDASLFFQMTVLDNTMLPAKHQRGENPFIAPFRRLWRSDEHTHAADADNVLNRVLLRDHYDKPASDLSGGQMKLLEIARSLMGEPKMLLLDEPTAGVAPNLAYSIFEQIKSMCDEYGVTFLIVEHRLEILFDFVDSLYVMHMGDMLAEGSPQEIMANEQVREVYFGD
ncbi:MAG: ABC transporter ATP-binding protein [Chloroflexota bacterium]